VSTRPETDRGALWAADVLYVSVRNFGVLKLAENQTYHFSYAAIIEELIRQRHFPRSAETSLTRLRQLKMLYRNGRGGSSDGTDGTIENVLRFAPRKFFPSASLSIDPAKILADTRASSDAASPYERLRNLEKAFVAASALHPKLNRSKVAAEVLSWIENPRAYVNVAAKMERRSLRRMRSVAAALAAHQRGIGK
jgi:hypothetical protein